MRPRPPAYGLRPTVTPRRGAMTLVELLVVIVLISTLVATAIPILSPGGDDRKLREASRNVNTYLQGAQARAMQTGRPFGVAIERLSADTERGEQNAIGVRMQYVEVPPIYTGFSDTSAARLAVNPEYAPGNTTVAVANDIPMLLQFVSRGSNSTATLPVGWQADLLPPRFLRPGDTVEIDSERYVLVAGDTNNPLHADSGYFEPGPAVVLLTFGLRPASMPEDAPISSAPMIHFAYDGAGLELPNAEELQKLAGTATAAVNTVRYWTEPKPYKVLRQPAPAGGEPLELPSGVAIDLQASALGGNPVTPLYEPWRDFSSGSFQLVEDPIMILFAPEGHVHRVYGVGVTKDLLGPNVPSKSQALTGFIALCVGRTELIPGAPQGTPSRPTYADPIDTNATPFIDLTDPEQREITDLYNWLNLESRWVVVSGQTGAITTVENVTAPPSALKSAQVYSALENARSRIKMGGR